MKKILFLLLCTVQIYGQTSNGSEQEFDYGIKNNSAQTITTPPYLTTTGMDGTQGKIPSALIAKTSDVADSLATKENVANKSDSYTTSSSITYASTAALVGGLATKENAFTKNTAFNKNFGTTAGTVVEGGTLGSNAYTSTAFLPLGGGDINGLLKITRDGYQLEIAGTDQGAVDLYRSGTLGHRLFSDVNKFGIYDLENGSTVLSIAKATEAATFSSTVTATSFNGSATLTGTPTAPTAATGTTGNQIATLDFVQTEISNNTVSRVTSPDVVIANGSTTAIITLASNASYLGHITYLSNKTRFKSIIFGVGQEGGSVQGAINVINDPAGSHFSVSIVGGVVSVTNASGASQTFKIVLSKIGF